MTPGSAFVKGRTQMGIRTNRHDPKLKARIQALFLKGLPVNQVARAMGGMVDRTTLQIWAREVGRSDS